jgi:hypothetical protein
MAIVKNIDAHRVEGVGPVRSGKLSHKNAIKHKKGTLLDFMTTPSIPLKRIWPKPQGPIPPGFPTTVHFWSTML